MSTADWYQPLFYALLGALALFVVLRVWRAIQQWRQKAAPPSRTNIVNVHVVERIERPAAGSRRWLWDTLTEREMEIARLVEQGRRNGDIACELALSPNTVETHLKHIYVKLQVRGRMELVKYLHDEGIL